MTRGASQNQKSRTRVLSPNEISLRNLEEMVRQYRFKTRAMGKLLECSIRLLPEDERGRIGGALVDLLMHTANEKPLVFEFDGHKVVEP